MTAIWVLIAKILSSVLIFFLACFASIILKIIQEGTRERRYKK